ncbi:hypothetical protein NX059_003718 [Plenodomus lindquistii]|nr:hypothetical protein NX059_003718 [Plenodomus lindquistii]
MYYVNNSVGDSETKAQTGSVDVDKHGVYRRVSAEVLHKYAECVARPAAVKADVRVDVIFERDFNEVEVRGPEGEDNAAVG